MSQIKLPSYLQAIVLLAASLLIIGFFVSRAFMSIGMIGLTLPFFLHGLKENIRFASKSWLFWSSVLLILVYMSTWFYSEDLNYFSHRMQLKLSLLCFPLAWIGLRNFPARIITLMFYFFLLLMGLEILGAIYNFLQNSKEITYLYIAGQVTPLPFNISHPRFSLMLACSVFLSVFLLKNKTWVFHAKSERIFLIVAGVLALFFVHLLAVRSGLLALYSGLMLWICLYILNERKYIQGILLLIAACTLPVLIYFTVPTVHNRIDYMVRDINNYLSGNSVYDYSDGNRLLSMKLAWDIGKTSPVAGIGLGDVENEMFASYKNNHPELPPKFWIIPHSQFLFVWLAAGIAGLIALLLLIFVPYLQPTLRRAVLPLLIHTAFVGSFLSESTLENQLGSLVYGFLFWMTVAYAGRQSKVASD